MEHIVVLDIGERKTAATRFCVEDRQRLSVQDQQQIDHLPGETVLRSIAAGLAAWRDVPELRCYVLIPPLLRGVDFSEVLGEVEEQLRARQDHLRQFGIVLPEDLYLVDRREAFGNICDLARREVGKVIIVEMRAGVVTVASNISGNYVMTEFLISPEDRTFDGESAAGIVKTTERRVKAISDALKNHLARIGRAPKRGVDAVRSSRGEDGAMADWIIAAGEPLGELPNDLQVLENGLKELLRRGPASPAIPPILIERYGIVPAIGAVASDYPAGSWSLLAESLSVDS